MLNHYLYLSGNRLHQVLPDLRGRPSHGGDERESHRRRPEAPEGPHRSRQGSGLTSFPLILGEKLALKMCFKN